MSAATLNVPIQEDAVMTDADQRSAHSPTASVHLDQSQTLALPSGTLVASLRFSPDGLHLAAACADHIVRIWHRAGLDAPFEATCQELKGHVLGVNDVAWSLDGKLLASASNDTTIRIWSPFTDQEVKVLKGHRSHVFTLAFHPRARLLLSGSFDESIKIWDIMGGTVLKDIAAHADPINAVAFNHDGSSFASVSYDGLLRMWDTQTGECLKSIIGHDNPPIGSVRFSPNDAFLLYHTLDHRLHVMDHATQGKRVHRVYKGHQNGQYCLFAHFFRLASQPATDSTSTMDVEGSKLSGGDAMPVTFVVSASETGEVCIWPLDHPAGCQTFPIAQGPIVGLDVCQVSQNIAASGLESPAKISIYHARLSS